MRRVVVLALLAALAACNPSAPGGGGTGSSSDSGGGMFPDLFSASYRAEGTITAAGRSTTVVTIRDGRKFRMEFSGSDGEMIIINNPEAEAAYTIVNAGGRRMAMRAGDDLNKDPSEYWSAEASQTATLVGPCSGAGETGREWSRQEDGKTQTSCVTSDGIILRATQDGQTTWETTQVQRGPQSADLFTLPLGVQVMDLNNISGMASALEKMQQGGGQ